MTEIQERMDWVLQECDEIMAELQASKEDMKRWLDQVREDYPHWFDTDKKDKEVAA